MCNTEYSETVIRSNHITENNCRHICTSITSCLWCYNIHINYLYIICWHQLMKGSKGPSWWSWHFLWVSFKDTMATFLFFCNRSKVINQTLTDQRLLISHQSVKSYQSVIYLSKVINHLSKVTNQSSIS